MQTARVSAPNSNRRCARSDLIRCGLIPSARPQRILLLRRDSYDDATVLIRPNESTRAGALKQTHGYTETSAPCSWAAASSQVNLRFTPPGFTHETRRHIPRRSRLAGD